MLMLIRVGMNSLTLFRMVVQGVEGDVPEHKICWSFSRSQLQSGKDTVAEPYLDENCLKLASTSFNDPTMPGPIVQHGKDDMG